MIASRPLPIFVLLIPLLGQAWVAPPAWTDSPPAAEDRLAGVDDAMAAFIRQGQIVGAVTLVVDAERTLHSAAVGSADVADGVPLRTDSIFWIASMSKPITGACVMMMVDEKKIALDDPVDQYLPEMKSLALADGTPVTVTLRQLMTHTSGMSDLPPDAAYSPATLAEVTKSYAELPVRFQPGTRWEYCQSGINTAARVVEVVSGMTFDRFVQTRICEPLGMTDTAFYLTDEQAERLSKTYRMDPDADQPQARIEAAENPILSGKPATSRDRFPAANGGLFSTAGDYGKFCQWLLNDGRSGDRQLLSRSGVDALRTICTGDLVTGFTPGNGWAIGVCVIAQPQGITSDLSPGTYGHGGAHGTQAWIDPVRGVAMILMVQRANFPNSDASVVRQGFQKAALDALD